VLRAGERLLRSVSTWMLAGIALVSGCRSDPSWSGEIAVADPASFSREVYPVLLADCAFSQCHGAEQRFFRVFGPGRERLKDASGAASPALEMQASYVRALSMLITDGSRPVAESQLLNKPLDLASGGSAHGGVDVYGRNVYRSSSDPNYIVLLNWALGARFSGTPMAPAGMPASSGNSLLVPSAGSGALNPPLQAAAGAAAVVPGAHP
jgi:hypothetical protein